jgi:hypothetical protein
MATTVTEDCLIAALRATGELAAARMRALPAEALERGVYENGWNGRQVVAHVAALEWTYPRLLDLAREAPAAPPAAGAPAAIRRTTAEEAPGLPTRPPQGGIDDYNARQVEKRAAASFDELIAEFERNRAATIAAVEGADQALLDRHIRSAGGITGRRRLITPSRFSICVAGDVTGTTTDVR